MRLFVFAIGGTGARVMKSLVMMLAAGVRPLDSNAQPIPDLEIVPIIIDPHKANEDLKRTEKLIANYRFLRNAIHGDGNLNAKGFFATRISNLKDLVTDSSVQLQNTHVASMAAVEHCRFREFIGFDTMNEANQALTSMLFADYQLDNKMNIGFVGSPNIGSVALNQFKDSVEFHTFANAFNQGDRIFFISSIFGGTGAAGFPILVKNIRQAENLQVSNKDFLRKAPIGALTMLPYFNIEHNDDNRIDRADFIVKTQSALHYYNQTLTSERNSAVNAIYYVGDQISSKPYTYDPGENGQRNNAHLVESVGALALLKFAAMPTDRMIDNNGRTLPTIAYEYGLQNDFNTIDFKSLGLETRNLVYNPMVKWHLLLLYMSKSFRRHIGRGFTEDSPKIKLDFISGEFYRVLNEQFMAAYIEWMAEVRDNRRSLQLFNLGDLNMNSVIAGVTTKKGFFGMKNITADHIFATMNAISMKKRFKAGDEPLKLMTLFDEAAEKLIKDKYEDIN